MSKWKTKSLGEITSYIAKGIPPKYVEKESDTTICVLNQKCNRNYRITYDNSRLHDCGLKKVPEHKMILPGDVLINSTGAGTAGRVAQIWDIPKPTTLDGHMILMRPTSEVHSLYYGYALKSQQAMIESYAEGSTGQTEINKERLKNETMISFPVDKQEQYNIARIVASLDEKIVINEKINKNLEEQAQTIFKSWFIDAADSKKWSFGTFSDIIETMIAGDWGKESPTGNNTEMVYCIRGADIPEVKAGNKGKMPTRYILPKNYEKKQLVAGDIVVEISGGSPTQSTGRIAAISQSLLDRYDKGMVCTNFCKAMKPKEGYSMFAYYYWQYLYDRNVFFLYENGTTGIKNLDISGFLNTEPIVIPPIDLIQKFNNFCNVVFDTIFTNGLQNEHLAAMRDSLLPKLLSGELDLSDFNI